MSKPRTGIPGHSGLGKVVNESAWGVATAKERYGVSQYPMGRANPQPDVKNKPQKLGDPNNLQDLPRYDNIHRDDWIRGKGESAEGKPNFHPGVHGKK